MARLKAPPSRLAAIRPKLQAPKDEAGRSQYRRDHKGHDLYDSRRRRGSDSKKGTDGLRWQVLLAAQFTCQMCGTIEADTSKLVADHRSPHRGDRALFFDRKNLMCLCQNCHSGRKQSLEKSGIFD